MKVYQLHIGSNSTGTISTETEAKIQKTVANEFPSFSVLRGRGYFRGTPEDLLIVKIATDNQPQVYQLASKLRQALNQDGIGVEHDGEYHRVVE
ncbi:MAG: hypothetical protein WCG79_12545 [Verrucomicrobiota bacterium]|jgi:hypothetical protein